MLLGAGAHPNTKDSSGAPPCLLQSERMLAAEGKQASIAAALGRADQSVLRALPDSVPYNKHISFLLPIQLSQ